MPNQTKKIACLNIRWSFCQLDAKAQKKMLRANLQQTAQTLLEMPSVWYGQTQTWLDRLQDDQCGMEIRQGLKQGRGLIIAMPHLGNFEISAHYFAQFGQATGLYRPPRQKSLESFMLEGRTRPGQNRMVATDRQGIKSLYQAIKRGEIIVILPDQQPKSKEGGVFAPFFGRPAFTMRLIHRLAYKTQAPVYFIAFIRQNDPIRPYRVIGHWADKRIADPDPIIAATALNQGVERCILNAPEQYQWVYPRFKKQPDGSNPYHQSC